jgi:hypothetical protein
MKYEELDTYMVSSKNVLNSFEYSTLFRILKLEIWILGHKVQIHVAGADVR